MPVTEADNEKAPAVAMINQTMAKQFWSTENVVGKRFSIKGATGTFIEVVGVVQDGKYNSVVQDPTPFYYLPLNQRLCGFSYCSRAKFIAAGKIAARD
jgi:hypothetical protein